MIIRLHRPAIRDLRVRHRTRPHDIEGIKVRPPLTLALLRRAHHIAAASARVSFRQTGPRSATVRHPDHGRQCWSFFNKIAQAPSTAPNLGSVTRQKVGYTPFGPHGPTTYNCPCHLSHVAFLQLPPLTSQWQTHTHRSDNMSDPLPRASGAQNIRVRKSHSQPDYGTMPIMTKVTVETVSHSCCHR